MLDKTHLKPMLSGRVVIACIGNEMRGDDGFGPLLSRLIRPGGRVAVVDCGDTPENYLGVIVKLRPERILILDAADFGGRPGEVRSVAKKDIAGEAISTHAAKLTVFAEYLEAQTGGETFFIAVQPKGLGLGEGLSSDVDSAARELARMMNEVIEEVL